MKILSRYVLREFLIPLGYCLFGFISIFVLFELFSSLSHIAEAKLPFLTIVKYFAAYIAPFAMYLVPAALMLATLYTMWNFCRHSEITAMRASGVSFTAIVKPLLLVALVMAGAVAWIDEVYVPQTARWANKMKEFRFSPERVAKADKLAYYGQSTHCFWTADRCVDDDPAHLEGVRISISNLADGTMTGIQAARADYLDGEWWLTDARVTRSDGGGRLGTAAGGQADGRDFRTFPELTDKPADIIAQNRDRFNSVRAKFRFIRRNRLDDAERAERTYAAWAQAVAPLACLVITLFAIPAGISSGRQSVFRGVLGAIGLFFAFYGVMVACMVAAHWGYLPPVVAALLPDVLFLALGIRSFRRLR